eukprot:13932941-Alexandrium_andersonii.AAC.1
MFYLATWGAAKRRPRLHCQSALAHSEAPIGRQPRDGPEAARGRRRVALQQVNDALQLHATASNGAK